MMKLTTIAACLLLSAASSLRAQPARDVSGHWEGSIAAPGMALSIEVDLTKNSKGELVGTISIPAENLKSVPLSSVSVNGPSVRFVLRAGSGGGPFEGSLSADGKTISGDFVTRGLAIPFSMTWTGAARINPPAKSPSPGGVAVAASAMNAASPSYR